MGFYCPALAKPLLCLDLNDNNNKKLLLSFFCEFLSPQPVWIQCISQMCGQWITQNIKFSVLIKNTRLGHIKHPLKTPFACLGRLQGKTELLKWKEWKCCFGLLLLLFHLSPKEKIWRVYLAGGQPAGEFKKKIIKIIFSLFKLFLLDQLRGELGAVVSRLCRERRNCDF